MKMSAERVWDIAAGRGRSINNGAMEFILLSDSNDLGFNGMTKALLNNPHRYLTYRRG
jgi:hypothetical protein